MRFLVILFALLFLFLYPIPYTLTPSLAHSETQVIEMIPSGFTPDPVTVDSNQTIIFINKDSKDRWPASNVHPTHDLYPQFDPKRPVKPGESWTFKPTKEGSWKYHDHLFPHMRGTITVKSEQVIGNSKTKTQETNNPISTFLRSTSVILSEAKDLILRFFGLRPQNDNLDAAKKWEELKQKYKGQAGSEGDIHDQAHLAGSLIFKEKGFDGITICSAEFAFGCYHGLLDTAFAKSLDQLLDAQDACLKLGKENSGPVASCIHGIGHGVSSYYSSADLKKALSSCRKLTSGREYCFDGVFMEYVRSAPESAFKKDDPLYPCNELEKEFGPDYSFECGRNQPPLLMSRFKMGFEDVVEVCLQSKSQQFKDACFDALGLSVASAADAQIIINACSKITRPQYQSRCIVAGAGELIFQEVPGWAEKYKLVCSAIPDWADQCLKNAERLINEYGRKTKISFRQKEDSEDVNEYLRSQIKLCYEVGGRDSCYKDLGDLLYSQFGLKKTLELLRANEEHIEVYARCHEVTHYLSRSEYEKQKSIAKVYAVCDSTCHGGCYHGTLEAYLKRQQENSKFDLNAGFPKICGQRKDYQKPIEYNECMHGLGHAAMFVTDMELKDSLGLCDGIADPKYRERCFTGVFMENSSSSTSFDHQSKYIKSDDPFYPCNSLDEKYQPICWQYQSSYFSIISGQDWNKVAKLCLQIPEQYQDRCFRTIGTNQVGFTQSLQTMKADCDLMPTEHFKDVCIAGVVSSLAYRFVGESKKIIEFCMLVNPDNQETCFKQMGTGIKDWNSNKDLAKKECKKIPSPNAQNWCLSVI